MKEVRLHIHSEYSLLYSTARINKLVETAQNQQIEALGLTDTNTMFGAVPFYNACIEAGIKPVIGLELTVKGVHQNAFCLSLYAENDKGYQELMRLSSESQRISLSLDDIAGRTEHLFAVLPWEESEAAYWLRLKEKDWARDTLEKYKQTIAAGRLYLEWPEEEGTAGLEEWKEEARAFDLPLTAGNNIRMADRKEYKALLALHAVKQGIPVREMNQKEIPEHALTSYKQESETQKEAAANAVQIVEACSVTMQPSVPSLPSFPLRHTNSSAEELNYLCREGMKKRFGSPSVEAEERLAYELNIIENTGFADYFLIVQDFIHFARNSGIAVGPGRGSAAGSLAAYVLEITDVDPLYHELLFERFLNPDRVSFPDIDIDFQDDRRDEVIRYTAEKYGTAHVAQIGTFGTFGARAAIRDIGRILESPQALIEKLAGYIPAQPGKQTTIAEVLRSNTEMKEFITREKAAGAVVKLAAQIEGMPRHTSVHAAGVIISKHELTDHVPLLYKEDAVPVTQYPMGVLEAQGLTKIDFLGLRNLSMLQRMEELIKRKNHRFSLRNLPLDNDAAFALLAEGNTDGVFQLESDGMKKALKQIHPDRFEDITAVNALYRPGPMEFIPNYAARKHGSEQTEFPHPDLQPILGSTYGVIVYQEQIMQIAALMAGYTYGQADLLRRAVSKKKREVLEEEREAFTAGAVQKGYTKETASKVYDTIVRFADYGFNKSHAVAYSVISYQLAYIKANEPSVFYTVLLALHVHNKNKLGQYKRAAEKSGISFLPPSINKSYSTFKLEQEKILFGFNMIKQVGNKAVYSLIEERKKGPFTDLIDFCMRVSIKEFGRTGLEMLIKSGACDEWKKDRAVLLASMDRAMEFAEFQKELGGLVEAGDDDFRYVDAEPYTTKEAYEAEKEATGLYLSGHPLDEYTHFLPSFHPEELGMITEGKKKMWAAGIEEECREIRTKKGEKMAFLTITDGDASAEVVIFPFVYRKVRPLIEQKVPMLIQGRSEAKGRSLQIIAEAVLSLPELNEQSRSMLWLKIDGRLEKSGVITQVKKIVNRFPGSVPVNVFYERTRETVQLGNHLKASPNPQFMKEMEKYIPKEFIVFKPSE